MSILFAIALTAITGAIAVGYVLGAARLLNQMETKMKENMKT